jgi:hypothetical protein
MEDVRAAHRAKPEPEAGTSIASAHVLGGLAEHTIRSSKTCECGKDTPRPSLAGEAMANANEPRFTVDFDAKLTALARSCTRCHFERLDR